MDQSVKITRLLLGFWRGALVSLTVEHPRDSNQERNVSISSSQDGIHSISLELPSSKMRLEYLRDLKNSSISLIDVP